MITTSIEQSSTKGNAPLEIPEEIISCALNILYQNRNLVNAIDNKAEMDDYIYRAVLKQAFEKAKLETETAFNEGNAIAHQKAEKDLAVLSREELVTDPFYRAVLPLLVKVVTNEPILRLHADVASGIILNLADFKRKHRATSVTEIIVKHYAAQINEAGF
jgi:hypothetical protein